MQEAGHAPRITHYALEMYRSLHKAMTAGLVRACHDVSEGGLAVAAAEMCIGGRLGLALTIGREEPIEMLFGETNGRLLIEVCPEKCRAFEAFFDQAAIRQIGVVTAESRLTIAGETPLISVSVDELVAAWSPNE